MTRYLDGPLRWRALKHAGDSIAHITVRTELPTLTVRGFTSAHYLAASDTAQHNTANEPGQPLSAPGHSKFRVAKEIQLFVERNGLLVGEMVVGVWFVGFCPKVAS